MEAIKKKPKFETKAVIKGKPIYEGPDEGVYNISVFDEVMIEQSKLHAGIQDNIHTRIYCFPSGTTVRYEHMASEKGYHVVGNVKVTVRPKCKAKSISDILEQAAEELVSEK